MEQFTYTNIFATKGIEYLAIIAFLVLLIPFWFLLNKKAKVIKSMQSALGALTAETLRIPQGIFFSRNHTWTHLEKNGAAKVGLDDLLLHITGQVELKNLKNPGETIRKGDLLAEIDQNGKTLSIYSPITGKIIGTNKEINNLPEELSADPYGAGWIYKIKPASWKAETNTYLLAEDATSWSIKELKRFRDFMATSMKKYSPEPSMLILQDGGELRDNLLSEMSGEVWQDFQKSFLSNPLKNRELIWH